MLSNGYQDYTLWEIGLIELCHFTLSFVVASSVALLALLLISITSPSGCSIFNIRSLSQSMGPTRWRRVIICTVLLSLGAGYCAHVLEDTYFAWF
jgi:hypothetical protein